MVTHLPAWVAKPGAEALRHALHHASHFACSPAALQQSAMSCQTVYVAPHLACLQQDTAHHDAEVLWPCMATIDIALSAT